MKFWSYSPAQWASVALALASSDGHTGEIAYAAQFSNLNPFGTKSYGIFLNHKYYVESNQDSDIITVLPRLERRRIILS